MSDSDSNLEREMTRMQRRHVLGILRAGLDASFELDSVSCTLLVHLQDHGPLRAPDLSKKSRVTRASISRLVTQVSEAGRASPLSLTFCGNTKVAEYAVQRRAAIGLRGDPLSPRDSSRWS
jgi:hypothetical protein